MLYLFYSFWKNLNHWNSSDCDCSKTKKFTSTSTKLIDVLTAHCHSKEMVSYTPEHISDSNIESTFQEGRITGEFSTEFY